MVICFFFSSRRRHTRSKRDWSSDVCSSDLTSDVGARSMFALWFIAGCSIAALLLYPLYGINKNQATPSWCLWACAITAALWRSEERRVGKECRSRWSRYHPKKKNMKIDGERWLFVFFFQAEDGIRDRNVTGVQTCALPI